MLKTIYLVNVYGLGVNVSVFLYVLLTFVPRRLIQDRVALTYPRYCYSISHPRSATCTVSRIVVTSGMYMLYREILGGCFCM